LVLGASGSRKSGPTMHPATAAAIKAGVISIPYRLRRFMLFVFNIHAT
jgi:hypothetical protein